MEKEFAKERKHYPKENSGAKNEWKGMVIHYEEINNEIKKIEKEIQQINTQSLISDYEKQILNVLIKKKKDLDDRKNELELILINNRLYEDGLQQFKQDQAILKENLAQNYHKNIIDKEQILKKYKEEEKAIERKLLEENYRKMEEEKQKYLEKKEKEKQIYQNEIKLNQDKKIHKYNEIALKNQEIDIMNKDLAMKQRLKDENYNKFFQISNSNQKNLEELHKKKVLTPNLIKEKKQQEMIEKNIEDINLRISMQDYEKMIRKKENLEMVNKINLFQSSEHEKLKERKKYEREMQNEMRMKELTEYNQYLEKKKFEKIKQQNLYKNNLQMQTEDKERMENEKFRMTKNEKKINYGDLQAFKEADPSLYSMIPGWSPQIGAIQIPTKQSQNKDISETNEFYNEKESKPSPTKSKLDANIRPVFSPKKFSPEKLKESLKNFYNNVQESPANIKKENLIKRQLYNNNGYKIVEKNNEYNQLNPKKSDKEIYPLYGHNPLLNPMPYNIQNPYLQRDFIKRKNILSQIGQNTIQLK